MQAGPFTSSELRAAAAEMQAETQADGEVSTAVQPSHHAQGNKLYLATHQPAFERALLLAVGPHVETRPRTAGLGTLCLLARLGCLDRNDYGCGPIRLAWRPLVMATYALYLRPTVFLYQVKQIAKERTPFPISRLGELLLLQSSEADSQVLLLSSS